MTQRMMNHQKSWVNYCNSLRLKLNAGHLLESFIFWYSWWIGFGAVGILLFRLGNIAAHWPEMFFSVGVVFTLLFSYFIQKQRFFSQNETFVWMETRLSLNSKLTAAREGITHWPDFPNEEPDLLDWNWKSLGRYPFLALLALGMGSWVPLPMFQRDLIQAHQKPPVLQEVESWMQILRQNPSLDPNKIAEWSDQLKTLAEKSPEEWYRHQNLEASDTLHQNMERSLKALNEAVAPISKAIEKNAGDSLSDQKNSPSMMMEQNQEAIAKKMSELGNKNLPINPLLQEKLRSLSGREMKTLSPEELKEMITSMEELKKSCQACLGKKGDPVHEIAQGTLCNQGSCIGTEGEQKSAPLTLSRKESQTDFNKAEGLEGPQAKKPFLSDVVGVSTGEHDVKKDSLSAKTSLQKGAEGTGGEGYSSSRLTPEEEREMEKFFR